jgi:hypothetical protein
VQPAQAGAVRRAERTGLFIEFFAEDGMLDFKACGKLNWLTTTPTPGTHSCKSDEFYPLVEAMSPGPYLDLFSRGRAAEFEEKLVRLGHAIIVARDVLDTSELTAEMLPAPSSNGDTRARKTK